MALAFSNKAVSCHAMSRIPINESKRADTCASVWALAVERGYAVMTGGPVVARSAGTVIDVIAAVVPSPAVHTHTLVAAIGVVARAAILTGVGH